MPSPNSYWLKLKFDGIITISAIDCTVAIDYTVYKFLKFTVIIL
jgi:hypothetical protein